MEINLGPCACCGCCVRFVLDAVYNPNNPGPDMFFDRFVLSAYSQTGMYIFSQTYNGLDEAAEWFTFLSAVPKSAPALSRVLKKDLSAEQECGTVVSPAGYEILFSEKIDSTFRATLYVCLGDSGNENGENE